jgi:peptidyl-prolyl cis-trans isomerase C
MTSCRSLITALSFVIAANAWAQTSPETPACNDPSCPIAKRGTAVITVADVMGKISTLDARQQNTLLSDGKQLNTMIENLLILRQIANDADPAKVESDVVLQARLAQGRDELVAVYRLDQIRAERITTDFERLAREYYLANQSTMRTKQEATVRHLLVETANRGEILARAEVDAIAKELAADSTKFVDLVMEKSDDPSKTGNAGIIKVVEGTKEIEPEFVEAALALTKVGEISKPVRTEYGYHLLQLMDVKPAKKLTFEESKPEILEKLRQDARRRVVTDYRADLMASGKLEIFPQNLEGLIFGEDDKASK